VSSPTDRRHPPLSSRPSLLVRRIDARPDPERAFAALYGESPNAFWLDSSATGERARFSFIGDDSGPLGASIAYDLRDRLVRVERGGKVEVFPESIFEYLARELRALRQLSAGLPFGFDCGFVGYFGYELKAECDGEMAHFATTPDAAFVFADRLIAFDHLEGCTYLVCLVGPGEDGDGWIERTVGRLSDLPSSPPLGSGGDDGGELRLRRSRKRYLDDIAACKRYLRAGDTYEVCLTNRVLGSAPTDPLALYRRLRRVNPAPFAAYLRFGGLAVLSSSPERFLEVDHDRWVEARPIKGTAPRGGTPSDDARLAEGLRADAKSRAENVTIVDLLRNDLGRVCEFGTVDVPELMRVESLETVHQLVSSVRGRLREGLDVIDCVRACFPPGSMTGAPKRRTMQILDRLEGEARGVYSGAIGYLGLGGRCDLSVAIRAIVCDKGGVSIGAGGAIVVESDPAEELAEMLLKVAAPAAATQLPLQGEEGVGSPRVPILGTNL